METQEALRSLGFQVVNTISEGQFSKVVLATSEKYSGNVAIKIIDKKRLTAFLTKQLPQELAILRTVKHPHIVAVHEVIELANGLVFIVMEAAVTDLQKMVRGSHLPIDQAKKWFLQLVSAVVYLHQQDIEHRNIKCSNILLTEDEEVKLSDFSFGRISKSPELSKTFCYTPHFAAPEVLLGKPYDPKKSDVWSLGVLLYVMLTGSRPFDDISLKRIHKLQKQPLRFPVWLPVDEDCFRFFSYILECNPSLRPTAEEVEEHPWLQGREKQDIDEAFRSLGFEMVSHIGEGSFGKVVLATSQNHTEKVAIKVVNRKRLRCDYKTKFLPQEIDILKIAKHPNIVTVHDVFEMPSGLVLIVMDAAATTLQQKIDELRHIPIAQARKWFGQLVSAVVYLHQQDIVHRDLKCENVLLTADGQVKLTDFTLSRVYKGPDLSNTFCCTPHYAAPEVLLGQPYDPKKSDVWSLGVVLYTMVTGSMPFRKAQFKKAPEVKYQLLVDRNGNTVDVMCQYLIYQMLTTESSRISLEEVSRHPWLQEQTVGRFVIKAIDEDLGKSSGSSSGAGQAEEAVEEEHGCSAFYAAFRRAAKTAVVPIVRASHSLGLRMKKLFRRNRVVPSVPSSQHKASPDVLLRGPVGQSDAALQQPTSRQGTRRLRFPKFEILKKRNRIHPQ